MNLEAGAQAIQASAAAAVQNVIRSLKEHDKNVLNQILPAHMVTTDAVQRIQVMMMMMLLVMMMLMMMMSCVHNVNDDVMC